MTTTATTTTGLTYRQTSGSKIGPDAPSAKGFAWIMRALLSGRDTDTQVELRHAGRCGRCARALTTPESVDTGFGPECSDKLGIDWSKRPEGQKFDVLTFLLGGNAVLTATSKATGKSITYKVRQAPQRAQDAGKGRRWFVSVLTGQDNEGDYTYLGMIFEEAPRAPVAPVRPMTDAEETRALQAADRADARRAAQSQMSLWQERAALRD